MRNINFRAMGCGMAAILDADTPAADAALAQVPAWFEQWEQRFSRFRPNSELSTLNRSHGWQAISVDLCRVIDTALKAAEWSDGLVVPTVLYALEQAGYDESFEKLTTRPPETLALPAEVTLDLVEWRAIKLDVHQTKVWLPEGARLDLGGTAKGWAAQHASHTLSTIAPALVDAGGDIALSGQRINGEPWAVAVDDPRSSGSNEPIALMMLHGGGVATSGRDYRRWMRNGLLQHHIIDPRTGRPAQSDVLSATVAAPSVVMAEIAAKVVLILGSADGLAWVESNELLATLLVRDDGSIAYSSRMEDLLWQ